MPQKLEFYQEVAQQLHDDNASLRAAQYEYEKVSQLDYTLPEPLDMLKWVVPYRSTLPYDSLRGGTKALTNLTIRPKIHPITVHKAIKDDATMGAQAMANMWETVLAWEFGRATRRTANFNPSVIWNALVYDELAAQVIHLPTQINALKAFGLDTKRQEAAMRYGNYAIKLADVKGISARYSDYMLEEVLQTTQMTAQQIVDFFGAQTAKAVYRRIQEDVKHASRPYLVADYYSLDTHAIWVSEGEGISRERLNKGDELFIMENPDPFVPWAIKIGGTVTERDPAHQRKPLLYPVVMAEKWLHTNILGTLGLSQGISEANAPLHHVGGTGAQNVLIDHSEPGGVIFTQQHQIYERIRRDNLDPALRELLIRYEAEMTRSTLPSVLMSAEAMPGESYSGFNLRVQTAIGSLMPFKTLAERFHEDIFNLMLLYSHYSGTDIQGYADDSNQAYIIKSEQIDPNVIEMQVELASDVPVDRVQKIASAVQMAESLNYSPVRVLEYLGETNPQKALEEWIQWKFVEAKVGGRLQAIAAMESGALEQMAQQMAMQMVEQMAKEQEAQAAQQGAQRGGGGGGQPAGPNQNPAAGGAVPIQSQGGGATYEGATGGTRAGGPGAGRLT